MRHFRTLRRTLRRTISLAFSALMLISLLSLGGCDNDTSNGDIDGGTGPVVTDQTCIGCHSSRANLELALGDVAGSKVPVPNKGDG